MMVLILILPIHLRAEPVTASGSTVCKQIILRAFARGLDRPVLALHGTSTQAVLRALQSGSFGSGLSMNDPRQDTKGYFYFFPIIDRVPSDKSDSHFLTFDQAYAQASRYANEKARQHYFLSELDLPFGNPQVYRQAHMFLNDQSGFSEANHFFVSQRGISGRRLEEVRREARKQKGIILGLSPDLAIHPWLPGDMDSAIENQRPVDRKISFPKGFHPRLVLGIEPLGDLEWGFFEGLEQGVHDPR